MTDFSDDYSEYEYLSEHESDREFISEDEYFEEEDGEFGPDTNPKKVKTSQNTKMKVSEKTKT
jgi:hypothetical protein